MKKTRQRKVEHDAMQPEYDFTDKKGVRGKYYRAYRQGHTVKGHNKKKTEARKVEDKGILFEYNRDEQNAKDLEIINRRADFLNQEAAEVLSYQVTNPSDLDPKKAAIG